MRVIYIKGTAEKGVPPVEATRGMSEINDGQSESPVRRELVSADDVLSVDLTDEEFALFAEMEQFIPLDRVRAALTSGEAFWQALEGFYGDSGTYDTRGPFRINCGHYSEKGEGCGPAVTFDLGTRTSLYVDGASAQFEFYGDVRPAAEWLKTFPGGTPVGYGAQDEYGRFRWSEKLPATLEDVIADLERACDQPRSPGAGDREGANGPTTSQ